MYVILSRILMLLVVANIPPSFAVNDEDRAVMMSIESNDIQTFTLILERGYDVNSFFDGESENWLMCDVTKPERIEFLRLALAMGGDVNQVRPDVSQSYAAPIMCAISHGNREAVHYLISEKADPDIIVCPECETRYQFSPIMEALISAEFRIAYEMLDIAEIAEAELETMRSMLEDVRYLPDPAESQQEYRLKFAGYLESRGYKLNVWSLDKEIAGEWLPRFKRGK